MPSIRVFVSGMDARKERSSTAASETCRLTAETPASPAASAEVISGLSRRTVRGTETRGERSHSGSAGPRKSDRDPSAEASRSGERSVGCRIETSVREGHSAKPERSPDAADCVLVTADGDIPLAFRDPLHELSVGTVQKCLDKHGVKDVDYVHGEDAVRTLAGRDATGILVPAMDKGLLFPAVEKNGPLPRKTFSMGEAFEKRYYMEARKIVKE